jgi:type VI secretion system protein ImpH
MQTAQRHPAPSLIEWLQREPHRFEARQAWRLLLRAGLAVRFRNRRSMAFAPSETSALSVHRDGVRLTPAAGGLLGSLGALPYHYTDELATAESVHGARGQASFIDACTQRAYELAFGAHDSATTAKLRIVQQAIAGPGPAAGIRLCYAGLLRCRAQSPTAVQAMLREHLGVPCTVQEFVRMRTALRPGELAALGGPNAALGHCMLGTAVGSRATRVRLRIGPLTRADYLRFLPGCGGMRSLAEIAAQFGCAGLSFEVQLILAADAVSPCVLHAGAGTALCVGQGALLSGRKIGADFAGVRYELSNNEGEFHG